jgi:hypothetical protein
MAPPFARADPPAPEHAGAAASETDGGATDTDGVDPAELWHWDTRGYLVIPGVMDEAWLAAANAALDPASGVELGLGRIVALYHRSTALYQIR